MPTSKDWQKSVDRRFEESAAEWKEIYQRPGVFEAIHQQRRDFALQLVEELSLPPEASILEIGCGAGSLTIPLAQRGFTVQAVDRVEEMLHLTRRAADEKKLGQRVRTARGDVHHLQFGANTFDLVIALGVIPWLPSSEKPLLEMARVLKPGGNLIVNADNRWRLNYILDPRRFPAFAAFRHTVGVVLERIHLRKPPASVARTRMHSRPEFDMAIAAAGLHKVQGKTLGFGPFSLMNVELFPEHVGVKLHGYLQRLAHRNIPVLRSTGSQYIVLASKPCAVIRSHVS